MNTQLPGEGEATASNGSTSGRVRGSDTEELRLVIAHYRMVLQQAATLARNSVRTNSSDVEDWRADMQMLADKLERDLAA